MPRLLTVWLVRYCFLTIKFNYKVMVWRFAPFLDPRYIQIRQILVYSGDHSLWKLIESNVSSCRSIAWSRIRLRYCRAPS